jgi:hypothetical protein
MKTLNILFAIFGMAFLLIGMAFLTINEPTAETEHHFFVSFFFGMVSVAFFLLTDKIIKSRK